jgi:microcystin-dependent protein
MGQQYLGEIRIVSFSFAPKGWASCNGQLLPINQNQALFSLLGTAYGGDGRTTFALPDFRGRTGMSSGSQTGSPPFVYGQPGGEEMHTLTTNEIPPHNHTPVASTQAPNQTSPSQNLWATGTTAATVPQYATTPLNTNMASNAIGNNTGGVGHDNRAPYQVLNFIIATSGIFPSRN